MATSTWCTHPRAWTKHFLCGYHSLHILESALFEMKRPGPTFVTFVLEARIADDLKKRATGVGAMVSVLLPCPGSATVRAFEMLQTDIETL